MQLSKVDISGELRVRYVSGGVEVWDRQIDLFSTNTKVRIMNDFYDLHWFDFPNGAEYGSNIGADIAISNEFIAMGDGADTTFSGTIAPVPVKAGTAVFAYTVGGTARTATAAADGTITGVDLTSGTIASNGTYSLTYTTAPDIHTPITVSYTRGSVSDDSIVTGYTFQLTTDATPMLDESLFLANVALTVAPKKMDRYEQNDYVIYETVMTGDYTGAATAAVTGVGIHYVASSGDSGVADIADNFIIKSTAPNKNSIYTASGLVLNNECEVTLKFRVKVSKK